MNKHRQPYYHYLPARNANLKKKNNKMSDSFKIVFVKKKRNAKISTAKEEYRGCALS